MTNKTLVFRREDTKSISLKRLGRQAGLSLEKYFQPARAGKLKYTKGQKCDLSHSRAMHRLKMSNTGCKTERYLLRVQKSSRTLPEEEQKNK